ncbi:MULTISPECIES: PIN domain-containing protein [Pectobacterium]|uniref:PIN domain-containing protein n=1 Tax=Pectobacterium TaxID=122277 RepID=UPI00094A51DD|nr:hypothetical protein [Pectobacterium brasiliense]APS29567.1 hypothetical protein NC16_07500 [Pectobacterium brasiliense]MBN3101366.1 DNA-binding protein [Pectobacterium brasiliense]WGL26575.1 hypothetical protein OWC53_14475 [Pectobacterium brasiliense]
MTKKILLDANLLIAAFDHNGNTSEEIRNAANDKLSELSSDPDVAFFITPLIRYEVLRGVSWQRPDDFQSLQQILNTIPELDITCSVSELAANLFRFEGWQIRQQNDTHRNIDKRKFDIFHFCSASCNNLELCSNDTDIGRIHTIYDSYCQATN